MWDMPKCRPQVRLLMASSSVPSGLLTVISEIFISGDCVRDGVGGTHREHGLERNMTLLIG